MPKVHILRLDGYGEDELLEALYTPCGRVYYHNEPDAGGVLGTEDAAKVTCKACLRLLANDTEYWLG